MQDPAKKDTRRAGHQRLPSGNPLQLLVPEDRKARMAEMVRVNDSILTVNRATRAAKEKADELAKYGSFGRPNLEQDRINAANVKKQIARGKGK